MTAGGISERPIAVWTVCFILLLWLGVSVAGLVHFHRPISAKLLIEGGVLLLGTSGLWLLRWWGALVVLAFAAIEYAVMTWPFLSATPDVRSYGLLVNGAIMLILVVPVLAVTFAYRRRFKWA